MKFNFDVTYFILLTFAGLCIGMSIRWTKQNAMYARCGDLSTDTRYFYRGLDDKCYYADCPEWRIEDQNKTCKELTVIHVSDDRYRKVMDISNRFFIMTGRDRHTEFIGNISKNDNATNYSIDWFD